MSSLTGTPLDGSHFKVDASNVIQVLAKDQTIAKTILDFLNDDPIAQWDFLGYVRQENRQSWGLTKDYRKNFYCIPLKEWMMMFDMRGTGNKHREVIREMIPLNDLILLMQNRDFDRGYLVTISRNISLLQNLIPYLTVTDLREDFFLQFFSCVIAVLEVLPRHCS